MHRRLLRVGLLAALVATTACRLDSTGAGFAHNVATTVVLVRAVDTSVGGHVGLDIGLGNVLNPYNPCHPHTDSRGAYNDSFYAACQDSRLANISYFKHWDYGPGGRELNDVVAWGNVEANRCGGAPWCPAQPATITTDWARRATTWALEFYPHTPDEGGARVQGQFPNGFGDWAGSEELGTIHVPRRGDPGIGRLLAGIGGGPRWGRFQLDVFQRTNLWLRTSSGHLEEGFSSVTNAGGYVESGPLPEGGYHIVVTDNDTGQAFGISRWISGDTWIGLDPGAPCFGLSPASAPYDDSQRRC